MSSEIPWHMDKKVPLIIIITVIILGAGFVTERSELNSRLSSAELAAVGTQARVEFNERAIQVLQINSATITARLTSLDEGQREIKQALDQQNALILGLVGDAKK